MYCLRSSFLTTNFTSSLSIASRFFSSPNIGSFSVKRSELDNGVTVISGSRAQDTIESVGVFVNTGSAFENHKTHGSAHFLRRFLFKSTNRLSGLRLTRTIDTITASFDAENTSENLVYKSVFPIDQLNNVVTVMGDILRPRLAEWEFRDVRNLVKHDMSERSACQDLTILDKVRHIAYAGSGLGRSPLCPSYNVNEIYPEDLASYILEKVVGSNITVIGSVNDHEAFVDAVARGFGTLPKESNVEKSPIEESVYHGGSVFACDGPGSVYVEAYKGVDSTNANEAAAQHILGEITGAHLPHYAPGAPTSSRLASNLQGSNVSSANCFALGDSQTVFGVRAFGNVPCRELADNIHNQLVSLSNITEEEFESAKKIIETKSRMINERRSYILDNIHKISLNPDANQAENVTLKDVQEIANKILSSKPTIYASGDLSKMPSYTH